jgi:hypothetical protein
MSMAACERGSVQKEIAARHRVVDGRRLPLVVVGGMEGDGARGLGEAADPRGRVNLVRLSPGGSRGERQAEHGGDQREARFHVATANIVDGGKGIRDCARRRAGGGDCGGIVTRRDRSRCPVLHISRVAGGGSRAGWIDDGPDILPFKDCRRPPPCS